MSSTPDGEQQGIDRYFDGAAEYWRDIYERSDVQSVVYRRRMQAALRWIDEVPWADATAVLEIGCGAGLLSVELAHRGLAVTAVDSSPEMVALLRRRAGVEHFRPPLRIERADAHLLPFDSGEFGMVAALGVLPWLREPDLALAEIARVLAPGGWVLLTADNRARLNVLCEPRESPLALPARRAYRRIKPVSRRSSQSSVPSYRHLPSEVDAMLISHGLRPFRRATVGYGPFTIIGRPLFPDALGARVHEALERASERRPSIRRTGWHYLVAARKP